MSKENIAIGLLAQMNSREDEATLDEIMMVEGITNRQTAWRIMTNMVEKGYAKATPKPGRGGGKKYAITRKGRSWLKNLEVLREIVL